MVEIGPVSDGPVLDRLTIEVDVDQRRVIHFPPAHQIACMSLHLFKTEIFDPSSVLEEFELGR